MYVLKFPYNFLLLSNTAKSGQVTFNPVLWFFLTQIYINIMRAAGTLTISAYTERLERLLYFIQAFQYSRGRENDVWVCRYRVVSGYPHDIAIYCTYVLRGCCTLIMLSSTAQDVKMMSECVLSSTLRKFLRYVSSGYPHDMGLHQVYTVRFERLLYCNSAL